MERTTAEKGKVINFKEKVEEEKTDPKTEEEIKETNKMIEGLKSLYEHASKGIEVPGFFKVGGNVQDLAQDYMKRHFYPLEAAKTLSKYQILKCGTSGFLTGLGGLITLPVAIPANISSVLYVQLRTVQAIAIMGGFDIYSDQVQSLVFACLTGSAMADILKQAGVQFGVKFANAMIKQIPGTVVKAINAKVGFRFITIAGEKGVINLVKLAPFAGGFIGGGVDIASTKIIADNAIKIFIKKEL